MVRTRFELTSGSRGLEDVSDEGDEVGTPEDVQSNVFDPPGTRASLDKDSRRFQCSEMNGEDGEPIAKRRACGGRGWSSTASRQLSEQLPGLLKHREIAQSDLRMNSEARGSRGKTASGSSKHWRELCGVLTCDITTVWEGSGIGLRDGGMKMGDKIEEDGTGCAAWPLNSSES